MKRLLLLPALLLGTASFADTAKYEISPMIGYDLAEGNVGIKGDDHYLGGLELQYNPENSKISPEFSVLYSPNVDYDDGAGDTSITRLLLNGVYSFDAMGKVTPFVKAGLGYEFVSSEIANYNEDGVVVDAGAGLKVPFATSWSFKAEALYLGKVSSAHNSNADDNLVAMVGLTYAFGATPKKEAPKEEVVEEVEEEVVIVPAEVDSDGDGVYDALDKCPDTPAGSTVGADGCPVVIDSDQDGVIDAKDLCPNTPAGEKVDANGCPVTVNLHITFANNSAVVPASADANLDKYAKFLTTNKNYSAKIVGYTDSRGSESYNQKLSERRAKAVMNALIERGVDPKQLSAIGMGELNPIASNDTAEGRAQNRRIEAELSYK